VKKVIYGLIKEGSRSKEYEMAMLWLIDCGLIHKVHNVSAPHLPLKAYEDLKAFKIVVPIEVKAETNLKAKSLKIFNDKYKTKLSIRTAMTDYKREDWLLNLPLWAVERLETEMQKKTLL
jgi:hypothetical protein